MGRRRALLASGARAAGGVLVAALLLAAAATKVTLVPHAHKAAHTSFVSFYPFYLSGARRTARKSARASAARLPRARARGSRALGEQNTAIAQTVRCM